MDLHRRDFLKLAAAATALLGSAPAPVERRNGMPYRTLGKTGEKVSLLCLGGAHIGYKQVSDKESIRLIRTAVDEGVNFLDNAWIYNDGRSESLMGQALKDGYRDKVFLMTKHYTPERSVEGVRTQLESSLQRLQVDTIDLWQIHQIHKADDPGLCYANDVMAEMEKARDAGKIRYIGFTGHSRPEWHLEMLSGGFAWDTVQMPINAADRHWTSFQTSVLPVARDKGIGIIAMKSLGGTPGQLCNEAKVLTARECLRYAMNMPVASVVSGIDSMEYLQHNLQVAKEFEPLAEEEIADILAKTAPIAEGGRYEPFKEKALA